MIISMYLVFLCSITAIRGTEFHPYRCSRREIVVGLAMMQCRHFNISLPTNLIHTVQGFMLNDWTRLERAFPNKRIYEITNEFANRAIRRERMILRDGCKIKLDAEENIVEITMWCHGVSPCNVSDLPPRLRHLALRSGSLTHLDLSNLPDGLLTLDISGNLLSSLDLTHLPCGLQILQLSCNRLKALKLNNLPPGLLELHIAGNDLVEINLSRCPKGLQVVSMGGNLMRGLIVGGCRAQIFGAFQRRGERRYMGNE